MRTHFVQKLVKMRFKELIVISLLVNLFYSPFLFAKKEKAKPKGVLDQLKFINGDEDTNDKKALTAELLVLKSEKLALKQVESLLKKYKGTPMEPGLWYRKAELYMRRARTERFFEIHRQSDVIVNLAPQSVKKASSKRAIKSAIKVYDLIQRRFPRFPEIDLVVFNNAFARQQIGQVKAAENLYWKVVRDYPQSPLVADCHLAIGELVFQAGQFKKALNHFNAIKNYPEARVYPYGLYKAAWTYYNLRDAISGLKELEKVVAYGKFVEDNQIDARLDLRKEALSDMTLFFEDVYPATKAYEYFSQQAGALPLSPILMKLARLYHSHGRYKREETVLMDFINEHPQDSTIPEAQNKVVLSYEARKDRTRSVQKLAWFAETCNPQSRWTRSQNRQTTGQNLSKNNQKAETLRNPLKDCQNLLAETSLSLSSKWLRLWKKNQHAPLFADVAEKGFRIYLKVAPNTDKAHQARFAYAELLFQRKKFEMASLEYEKVGKVTKEKQLGHDARYASLLSMEKGLSGKWTSEQETRFRVLAGDYVKNHPKGTFRLDIEFKVGLLSYENEKYDEAGPIFFRLGNEFAKKEKGRKAQDIYLDILNIKKDYAGLKSYAQKLKKMGGSKERLFQLNKIYEQSYFLQVQNMEEKGQLKTAMNEYKTFAQKNPKSALASKAWWNAVQLHYKTGDQYGGAKAGVEFYQRFSSNKEAFGALTKSAQTYEQLGQLGEAAEVLDLLSRIDSKKSEKWKLLAADYRLLDGQNIQAKKSFKSLLKSKDKQVIYHSLRQLKTLEESETGEVSSTTLAQIIHLGEQPMASLAQLRLTEKSYSQKNYAEAFKLAKSVLNMGQKASAFALAKARLIQAEILEQEFRRQSVRSKIDRVTMVLALKTEKLEKAQRAYQAVLRYGHKGLAVQALHQLAGCYKHYHQSLKNMPLPEGLTEAEAPVFRQEIEKLAIPMEERYVETLAQAVDQSRKLDIYDGQVSKIQDELDRVNMKKPMAKLAQLDQPVPLLPILEGGGR